MTFDNLRNKFQLKLKLKQGFYNYKYIVADKSKKIIKNLNVGGNFDETENKYSVVVYYRENGGRYDKVVGYSNASSEFITNWKNYIIFTLMVTKVTNGIKISVKSNFTGSFYEKAILKYCFEYIVEIENNSNEVVHLDRRQWYIYDSLNNIESVYGEGVVGEKPILSPGNVYKYKSSCLLSSPFGAMSGYYEMIDFKTNKLLKIIIPSFKLNAPYASN